MVDSLLELVSPYGFMMKRILLAAFLAGIIGIERSVGDRPAGLRTHVLVATGSALLMLVSLYGDDGTPYMRDPHRLAAQVVSGIGFLGAGTILHEGLTVKGLTTAASLWIVSAIGLACGCGLIFLSVFVTAMTMVTLVSIRKLERKVLPENRNTKCVLRIILNKDPDNMMKTLDFFQERNIKTRILSIHNDAAQNALKVDVAAKVGKYYNANQIIKGLKNSQSVMEVLLLK